MAAIGSGRRAEPPGRAISHSPVMPPALLRTIAGTAIAVSLAAPAHAADLNPATVAAFDRYVQATEARINSEVVNAEQFLWPQTLPPADRDARLAALRSGTLLIEKLETTQQGRSIDIPGGLVHHWVGVAFLPGIPIDRVIAILQDYDRHASIYAPRVARSVLRAHDDDTYRFHLRYFMKKGITVVVDSENIAQFTKPASDRAFSRIVSTRMAEVDEPGMPSEREKPIGHDGGYLWRLNSVLALSRARRWHLPAVRVGVAHPWNSLRPRVACRPVRYQPATRIAGVHARHDAARAVRPLKWRGSSSPAGARTATSTRFSVSGSRSVVAVTVSPSRPPSTDRTLIEGAGLAFHPLRPEIDPTDTSLVHRIMDRRRGSESSCGKSSSLRSKPCSTM